MSSWKHFSANHPPMHAKQGSTDAVVSHTYINLQLRAPDPFKMLRVNENILVIDDNGIPETIFTGRASHAPMSLLTALTPPNSEHLAKSSTRLQDNSTRGGTANVGDDIVRKICMKPHVKYDIRWNVYGADTDIDKPDDHISTYFIMNCRRRKSKINLSYASRSKEKLSVKFATKWKRTNVSEKKLQPQEKDPTLASGDSSPFSLIVTRPSVITHLSCEFSDACAVLASTLHTLVTRFNNNATQFVTLRYVQILWFSGTLFILVVIFASSRRKSD